MDLDMDFKGEDVQLNAAHKTNVFAYESPSKNIALSPASVILKRSPLSKSSPLKKALKFVRRKDGNHSKALALLSQDVEASSCAAKEEHCVDSLCAKLAISSSKIPTLLISEISEHVNFRFAFEGEVLCKYGTFRILESTYARFLKADLVDREGLQTITLVVFETFFPQFVEIINVNEFLHIEGIGIKKKNKNDKETSPFALHVDATTIAIKGEKFSTSITFFPEHKIRDLFSSSKSAPVDSATIAFVVVKIDNLLNNDGVPIAQLTIADGPLSMDRATLSFVPTRRGDFYVIVDVVKSKGVYTSIARNIGIFKSRANTLSIVDGTILTTVPQRYNSILKEALAKQVASLGFGKKVYGTLEVININSVAVEYTCDVQGIKGQPPSCKFLCFSCKKVVEILKIPSLQAKITLRDGDEIVVHMRDKVVDKVLGLCRPFLQLYESCLHDLKSTLLDIRRVGFFTVDVQGSVIDFKVEF